MGFRLNGSRNDINRTFLRKMRARNQKPVVLQRAFRTLVDKAHYKKTNNGSQDF
jgi:hypothetical protein